MKNKRNLTKPKNITLTASQIEAQRTFLQNQQEFIKIIWTRIFKQEELKEIQKQLTEGPITMHWYGQLYPKSILEVEYEINRIAYKKLIREEEILKRQLVGDGMTIEQVTKLWKTQTIVEKLKQ